jgi:hypothetical protein
VPPLHFINPLKACPTLLDEVVVDSPCVLYDTDDTTLKAYPTLLDEVASDDYPNIDRVGYVARFLPEGFHYRGVLLGFTLLLGLKPGYTVGTFTIRVIH